MGPLMRAAHDDNAQKIKELVRDGADLDAQDKYGWTALRFAVRKNRQDAAQTLVDLGADVNRASRSGRTPLMSAAGNGLSGMIRLLSKAGADLTLKCNSGQTAFDLSMRGGEVGSTACREM